MPTQPKHDPYAALRHPNYRYYTIGSFISVIGDQMLATAAGYELYERTNSATALGLWGLIWAAPFLLMALPGGHIADRYNRKNILLLSQAFFVLFAVTLACVSFYHDQWSGNAFTTAANSIFSHIADIFERHLKATSGGSGAYSFKDPSVPIIYLLLFFYGLVQSLNIPAKSAMLPYLVPSKDFANAVTWGSQVFQVASILGPALGGVLIIWGFPTVYLLCGVCWLIFGCTLWFVQYTHRSSGKARMTLSSLAAGAKFVWNTKIILATITMDLFAVFLGGAVALLPMFAKDILHVGPAGLGALRAAPSLGAFLMAALLTHLPPMKKAGKALLWAITGFGVATIVFGLSQWFWLSWLMLFLTGAFDNISVVVRATLVQVLTPDSMRGRVSAVSFMFIVSSNELGAFESGITAALFGPVASVVGGGIGTLLVVLAVMYVWAEVGQFGSLDDPLKRKKT